MMQPFFVKLSYSFSSSLTIFLVSLLLAADHGGALVRLPANVSIPAVIAFGDSIVDQGANNNINTVIKANFAPYGKDFVAGIPTGRFSNNKTPADIIVEQLGIKEIMPAYLDPYLDDIEFLTGVSFASGGSGFDPQTSRLTGVLSLGDQLDQFKEYIEKLKDIVGEERTQYILANSIFLVVAGTDDLAITYFDVGIRRSQYDTSSYTNLLLASASNFIQDIYKLGARRIGVFSAPPVGCLPAQRTLSGNGHKHKCAKKSNKAARLYNSKLQPELKRLNSTLLQSRIVYIDIYTPLFSMIKNPQQYGLEVVDRGCCGTGRIEVAILCNQLLPTCIDNSKYLFWDSFHPTEKGYDILTNQLLYRYIADFF